MRPTIAPMISCVFVAAVLLSACNLPPSVPPPDSIVTHANVPADQARIALFDALLVGFQKNDAESLYKLVAVDLQPRIDQWIATHALVDCQFTLVEERLSAYPTNNDVNHWQGNVVLVKSCPSDAPPRSVYTLEITGLTLDYGEQSWVVANWQNIAETWE